MDRWGIDRGSQNKSRQSSQEAGTGGNEGGNEKLCVEGNEICYGLNVDYNRKT